MSNIPDSQIVQDIYETLVAKVKNCGVFTSPQDDANLIEYTTGDETKRLYTSSDYPRLEIKPVSAEHTGNTSSSWNYTPTFAVIRADGTMRFSDLAQLMYKLLVCADQLKNWRKAYAGGSTAVGHSHSGVTFGKFAPDRGEETIDGWALKFTITFHAVIKHVPEA